MKFRQTVRLSVKGYVDRRTPALLGAARALEQARADKLLQERFEEGVRRREAQRFFQSQSDLPYLLRRQAS